MRLHEDLRTEHHLVVSGDGHPETWNEAMRLVRREEAEGWRVASMQYEEQVTGELDEVEGLVLVVLTRG